MQSSFIVTFIGDDRPGLVEQLSSAIERCGGNWQESRLSQLGGKFAGLVLVTLAEDAGDTLEQALKGLASSGRFHVRWRRNTSMSSTWKVK